MCKQVFHLVEVWYLLFSCSHDLVYLRYVIRWYIIQIKKLKYIKDNYNI